MSKAVLHTVGTIAGVHGIKGELRLRPYGDLEGVDLTGATLELKGQSRDVKIIRMRAHKGVFILLIEGVTTRSEAEALVGAELRLPESALPEPGPGEYYHYELIGLDVVTASGGALGRVDGIITTGANDVLDVRSASGAEVLIPLVEGQVVEIDIEGGRITVEPLEGLLPDDDTRDQAQDKAAGKGRR